MNPISEGSADAVLDDHRQREWVDHMIAGAGSLRKVLLIPPDITRYHSGAGLLTCHLFERLSTDADVHILPAIGTHAPMSRQEIAHMYPGIPADRFHVHDWRKGLASLGEVPADRIADWSNGRVRYPIQTEVARLVVDEPWDAIVSIGQLVPHEVIGIANHIKNIFIGVGGTDAIHKSHFLGAVWGMERMMGRTDTPVRRVLDYMHAQFASTLPIWFLLTVRGLDDAGKTVTRGLFAGADRRCFDEGSALTQRVNLDLLDRPLRKVVVHLDPAEYKSTWLGNKAIYRTRMAIEDSGELIVLAPGVQQFGEDPAIDRLIRKHGYRGTPATLSAVARDGELAANLSAAAHLIHGSTEGRFRVTYAPGHLSRAEIESAGLEFAELAPLLDRYSPSRLVHGPNTLPDGEEVYFIPHPGLGLWGLRSQFESLEGTTGQIEPAG